MDAEKDTNHRLTEFSQHKHTNACRTLIKKENITRKPFLSPSGHQSSLLRGIIILTSVAMPVLELDRHGIKLCVFLSVCVLSFNIFVIFIHVAQFVIAMQCSICMNIPQFIYSTLNGHLDCVWFSAIMKCSAEHSHSCFWVNT